MCRFDQKAPKDVAEREELREEGGELSKCSERPKWSFLLTGKNDRKMVLKQFKHVLKYILVYLPSIRLIET